MCSAALISAIFVPKQLQPRHLASFDIMDVLEYFIIRTCSPEENQNESYGTKRTSSADKSALP